jgi:HD-GYP domain-containing protein (c-di-GMP phosphodiesterase class II)
MKAIEVSDLSPGIVTECSYYSETGELLLSKGVTISQDHIDALFRRSIYTIYTAENEQEVKLNRLMNSTINDPFNEDLVPSGPPSAGSDVSSGEMDILPEVLNEYGIKDIKTGEEGFKQLLSDSIVQKFEIDLNRESDAGQPKGAPLSAKFRQMTVRERTTEYKDSITLEYTAALKDSTKLFQDIINFKVDNFKSIKSIVESIIKTYISDKNILLNMSSMKHVGEDYFFSHSLNVCMLSIGIAAAAGYSEAQIVEIGMGGLLHDIGMMLIPRHIRLKKGKLTNDEWYEVRKHPILALHVLEKIPFLPRSIASIAYQTHERETGNGYPKQRTSRFIHHYAKIVQVADIFESMCAPRPYRPPHLPYKAMETLVKMAHERTVNIDLVKYFLSYMSLFPVGSLVELADNRIAKVVQANGQMFAKPVISILTEKDGTVIDKSKVYQEDLKTRGFIQIKRPVDKNFLSGIGIMDGF